jgi:hypothetical protein
MYTDSHMRFLRKSYLDSRPEKLLPYFPSDLVNLVVTKTILIYTTIRSNTPN